MPCASNDLRKIIIVGAPRSGTNMLRDVLTSLPGVGTWPCDEINAIWRHGHLDYPYDDLGSDRTTPRARRYVRRAFARLAQRGNHRHIVEKTCATSLRVGYVARLLPEAQFVFIYRDGYDAVASAIKRWRSKVDLAYTLRKLRYAPVTDLPYYGSHFLANRIAQSRDPERRLPTWGPLTADVAEFGRRGDITAAAATQWSQCVSTAVESFDRSVDPRRVLRVRYEDLVSEPQETTEQLVRQLPCDANRTQIAVAASRIRGDRIGLGAEQLAARGEFEEVSQRIDATRQLLGYEPVRPP